MTTLPSSVPVLVVGAGVHGLSTAWHLAQKGERVLVVDKTGGRRRRVRDRLRRRAQQLLPARDERADGRVRGDLGVRPGGVPLPRLGLHRARPGGAGARPRRGARAPPADRLRLGADHRRGGGRRAHARAVSRLARRGPDRLPARAPRRLRVQPRVDARPGRQGARGGRGDRRGRRGDRLRARRLGRRDRRAHERGRRRGRAGRDRRRAVGAAAVVDARACPTGSTSTSPTARSPRDQPMWTYWYLQEGEASSTRRSS